MKNGDIDGIKVLMKIYPDFARNEMNALIISYESRSSKIYLAIIC